MDPTQDTSKPKKNIYLAFEDYEYFQFSLVKYEAK